MSYTYADIAKMIDHSLLVPTITVDALEAGLKVALAYDTASVCILPYYTKRCAEVLRGSTVQVSTTIGFPHGVQLAAAKAHEAKLVIADGAQELDMVSNISLVLSGQWDAVRADIAGVINVAHDNGAKVKVIFENCYLQDSDKIALCDICGELRADWVKTSTGFGTGGATLDDLRLMRAHSPEWVQVKAAGGVRTLDALLDVRAAGCTRCGATRTIEMMDECKQRIEAGQNA